MVASRHALSSGLTSRRTRLDRNTVHTFIERLDSIDPDAISGTAPLSTFETQVPGIGSAELASDEAAPHAAGPRVAFPPRIIRGCRVSIRSGLAYVEVAGAVFALPASGTDAEAHHEAVAVAVGMARDTVDGWAAGKLHELVSSPGFGTAVSS